VRRPFYSLKTSILADLIFLILAAMLLINVVMIRLTENDLLKSRVREGESLANALALVLCHHFIDAHQGKLSAVDSQKIGREIRHFLTETFPDFILVSTSGTQVIGAGRWTSGRQKAIALCRQSMVTGRPSVAFDGSTWAVIWLGYEDLNIASPLRIKDKIVGALAVRSHLSALYTHLRQAERMILVYILLNAIVLLAAGMFLLSRVVIRPIKRLLRVTQDFDGSEALALAPEAPTNEIGQLSHSLRSMLNRLDQNKQQLKDHISSLEKANEELRRIQEEVIRSEKLASVGRLAAGIAHEIGNPVGVVLGYIDLMKNQDLSAPEMKDALERCESEINRINRIIRQLLDYSRPSKTEPRPVNIHSLLLETVEMLEPQPIMSGIEVKKRLQSPKDLVLGDEARIKQVFVNIMLNAADAIDEKRRSNHETDRANITIETQNTGGSIKITFEDTGCGIAQGSINRIFDPFYSTKEPGKGTGLGLAVSYRIIEQMGGEITAESRQGKGTALHVILPLFEGPDNVSLE